MVREVVAVAVAYPATRYFRNFADCGRGNAILIIFLTEPPKRYFPRNAGRPMNCVAIFWPMACEICSGRVKKQTFPQREKFNT